MEYTEVFIYNASSEYAATINTDDWSQEVVLDLPFLEAGFYVISFSYTSEHASLSHTLEWRANGAITRGAYSENGGGIVTAKPHTHTVPFGHSGGPVLLEMEFRVPLLGFDVPVSEAFITIDRKA